MARWATTYAWSPGLLPMAMLRAAEAATRDEMLSTYSSSPEQLESAMVGVSALYARLSPAAALQLAGLTPSPPRPVAAAVHVPASPGVRPSPAATVVGSSATTRRQLFDNLESPLALSERLASRGAAPRNAARTASVRSPWLALSPGSLALSNPKGTEDALQAMLAHAHEASLRCRGLHEDRPFRPSSWDRCEKPKPPYRQRLEELRRQREAEARAAELDELRQQQQAEEAAQEAERIRWLQQAAEAELLERARLKRQREEEAAALAAQRLRRIREIEEERMREIREAEAEKMRRIQAAEEAERTQRKFLQQEAAAREEQRLRLLREAEEAAERRIRQQEAAAREAERLQVLREAEEVAQQKAAAREQQRLAEELEARLAEEARLKAAREAEEAAELEARLAEEARLKAAREAEEATRAEEERLAAEKAAAKAAKKAAKKAAGVPTYMRETVVSSAKQAGQAMVTKKTDKELREVFRKVDKDGSGGLERQEISLLANELGKKLSKRELDEAMKDMDKDGSGEVEMDEFITWWQGRPPIRSSSNRGSVCIHVGGLEGPELEDEDKLAKLFGRFGTVLATTLRIRCEVKDGKQVVSWALVSFRSGEDAEAALNTDLRAEFPTLVMRKVDELHAANSTGAMREVIKQHLEVRAAASPAASPSSPHSPRNLASPASSPRLKRAANERSLAGKRLSKQ